MLSYEMIFSFETWGQSTDSFEEYAALIGYPNLRVSDTDKYEGFVDFINLRTGQVIFQGFDGVVIEFDQDENEIRFYTGVKRNHLLYVYKENITKITEAENAETTEDKTFNGKAVDLRKVLKPYDTLHRPAVGSIVIWGDNTYSITGVETIPGCDLLNITIGTRVIRSDDLLKYCRYVNAKMCGWTEEEMG